MRRRFLGPATALLVATGCASAGSPDADPGPRVPVFEDPESVPCAFKPVERVSHRMTVLVSSYDQYEAIRDRELARLAAELGADAVVVSPQDPDRPIRINIETPMTGIFEGTAIRFTDPSCDPGSGGGR